jgi:hypothetical protein
MKIKTQQAWKSGGFKLGERERKEERLQWCELVACTEGGGGEVCAYIW